MSGEKYNVEKIDQIAELSVSGAGQPVHLENVEGTTNGDEWKQLLEDAIQAEASERTLGIKAAFRKYPQSVFWSFAISLCIVMEGYDTAIGVTGLEVFRKKYGHELPGGGYQLDPAWQAAPSSGLGNILGIFLSSWFQDRYGYRKTIQISLILITAFLFIVFFSPTFPIYWAGQFLCGIPWGAFSSSAVSYASEVTPVALRGYLTTYVNLCWVIGQFIAAGVLVGTEDIQSELAFKIPWAVQWVWVVPLFILATLAPDSPWWLVRMGRLEEAEKSIRKLSSKHAGTDPAKTVAMMVRTNQHELENQPGVSYWDCFRGSDLRRTEVACVGWMIQVLSGSSFGNQGTYFFEQAGLSQADAFKFNLGQYAIGFCGTCMSWYTMTRFGRRKVYLYGLSALCIILLIVGGLAVPSAKGDANAKWGQAALILIWVFLYDFTVGPVAYCIVGEVSSTRLRGKTVGLARNAYNIIGIPAGYINTYAMSPAAWNWKGYSAFFWFGSCFLSLVWSYFRLPECKGRTFRELDILFENGVPARKFNTTEVDLKSDEMHSTGDQVVGGGFVH